jgi:hypothetical protein
VRATTQHVEDRNPHEPPSVKCPLGTTGGSL